MGVIIVTMKTEETKPIYCSIRGLDRLNAVDPARYLEVKTKLGLAVAPYPGTTLTTPGGKPASLVMLIILPFPV